MEKIRNLIRNLTGLNAVNNLKVILYYLLDEIGKEPNGGSKVNQKNEIYNLFNLIATPSYEDQSLEFSYWTEGLTEQGKEAIRNIIMGSDVEFPYSKVENIEVRFVEGGSEFCEVYRPDEDYELVFERVTAFLNELEGSSVYKIMLYGSYTDLPQ